LPSSVESKLQGLLSDISRAALLWPFRLLPSRLILVAFALLPLLLLVSPTHGWNFNAEQTTKALHGDSNAADLDVGVMMDIFISHRTDFPVSTAFLLGDGTNWHHIKRVRTLAAKYYAE
jgi:hypothetical protein